PAVPLAERVMFLIWRSSTLIRSNRRTMAVLAFSAQSLRLSVSRALNLATASLTCPRRLDPRLGAASLRSSRRSLFRSRLARPGACSNSPVDRAADTATPRSMPTTSVVPGAVKGHPIRLPVSRCRAGPAEPHPPGLRNPDFTGLPAEPAHMAGLDGDYPKSLVPA